MLFQIAHFTKGTHEYFPIPQEQITFTNDSIPRTKDINFMNWLNK